VIVASVYAPARRDRGIDRDPWSTACAGAAIALLALERPDDLAARSPRRGAGDLVVMLGAGSIPNGPGAARRLAYGWYPHAQGGHSMMTARRALRLLERLPEVARPITPRTFAGRRLLVPRRRPAEVPVSPGRRDDLMRFLAACPVRHPGLRHRRRLQPPGARWRHRRRHHPLGRGFNEMPKWSATDG